MLNLVDMIGSIRKDEYDRDNYRPAFSDRGVREIRELLIYDRLFNAVDASSYDAVLITNKDAKVPVVGEKYLADVFFDKRKRFKDGCFIITSRVKSVTKLHHEIYMVETKNTKYLVIV